MTRVAWLAAILVCTASIAACATVALTPEGRAVVPVTVGVGDRDPARSGGCRLVAAHAPVERTELDLANEVPPFAPERNRAAAGGANVLIVRTRVIVPRGFECPAASPITDCPPQEGAWLRVTYEDYRCPDDALPSQQELASR